MVQAYSKYFVKSSTEYTDSEGFHGCFFWGRVPERFIPRQTNNSRQDIVVANESRKQNKLRQERRCIAPPVRAGKRDWFEQAAAAAASWGLYCPRRSCRSLLAIIPSSPLLRVGLRKTPLPGLKKTRLYRG